MVEGIKADVGESSKVCKFQESKKTLLDLYSGCGAMSTGLCFGASMSDIRLSTVSQKLNGAISFSYYKFHHVN